MMFSIQPILENNAIRLEPLTQHDFDALYQLASDPKIWEQHPSRDRWKKDVFATFFQGAIDSLGAFKIIEKSTNTIIGSTRFYDYNAAQKSILIGYTFYGTQYWGKGYNPEVKKLMLDYIFKHLTLVYFHVGADNIRSQIAISRLGAIKIKELPVAYFGEKTNLNFCYVITKNKWATAHLK